MTTSFPSHEPGRVVRNLDGAKIAQDCRLNDRMSAAGKQSGPRLMAHDPRRYDSAASGHNFVQWSPYADIKLRTVLWPRSWAGVWSSTAHGCWQRSAVAGSCARPVLGGVMGAVERIDGARLWADVMALAAITDPARPYTRRSFSPLFQDGRAWIRRRFAEAGLAVRLDAGGNLIGRIESSDPALGTIMLGSHSDTVPAGGRFDGIAGVIAALEVVRALGGRRLRHAIEVVDFLAEEPSEYGLSCVGSRAMAGQFEPRTLDYTNSIGERLGDAIDRIGGATARLADARRSDIAAYFELHIEQGIVLQSRGIDLGLVTGIVGIARVEITFKGAADHAGTTPMDLRHDAGLAAARTIAFVAERASSLAAAGRGYVVATAGVIETDANAANVVPGHARVIFDIRAEDHTLANDFIAELDRESAAIAVATRVERSRYDILSNATPAACDPSLRALLAQAADHLGFSTMPLASGAGHDAAFVSRIAPSAMLFVPCKDGKSHAPEEWAEPDALAKGAAVMLEAVRRFDEDKT
jgi:beta-ureidopropionase / N-carbamoyl-L-amino-acid hydrolase